MKVLVGAFNQEKALVGAFSVIVEPVVEPMEHYTALVDSHCHRQPWELTHSLQSSFIIRLRLGTFCFEPVIDLLEKIYLHKYLNFTHR